MSLTAVISNIARGSLHDGVGVRTVVYFKGCGLRCQWCHNPETFEKKREIVYSPVKCIYCGKCTDAYPSCHIIENGQMRIVRERCTGCGQCAEFCPTGAITLCGEEKTVEEVFQTILKDMHYYQSSNGGVTLSGGECLLQADFCTELLKKCKDAGIHTAIESALFVDYSKVEKVIPYVDFFYVDLKVANTLKHQKYTGQGNGLILDNIRRLSQMGKPIVIRIPLIPGVNDSSEDMRAFGEIIRGFSNGIKGIELLKYNPLASSKYSSIGKEYYSFGFEPQKNETMLYLKDILQKEIGKQCPVYFRK
ncbi:MAG: glycyl-radical enzyme activating protein [Clostridiales bacterium]|nr:glycyl-radical enzyme activating protein [Clostridiales bacterium]